jgi:hypothetical protein
VLALGPVAVGAWAITGNLLPWSILQGGRIGNSTA